VRSVLELVKLDRIFDLHEDAASAAAAFSAAARAGEARRA